MRIKRKVFLTIAILSSLALLPIARSLTTTITEGQITNVATQQLLTSFGMITGSMSFKLGSYSWQPDEIWLLPAEVDPDDFTAKVTQSTVLEIPANMTFSTCRTAVYHNTTLGNGFKIYNTGSSTQIFENGTFCGLAYNGTYHVYAKY